MVSLANNSRHSGGTFFSDDSTTVQTDDEPLLDSMPALPQGRVVNQWMAEEVKTFHNIKTPVGIILSLVLYVCLGAAANVLPQVCSAERCGDQETSLILYIHSAVWFLLVVVHYFIYLEHQNTLLKGYFNFHLETRNLRHASLHINSAANAVLLALTKILDALCKTDSPCPVLSNAQYLQIVISLEVLIALLFLVIYLVKTVRFNLAKEAPDFMRSSFDTSLPSTQQEVGFKPSFENQKDRTMLLMWYEIYFWRNKRVDLCREIIQLNDTLAELRSHSRHQ